MRHRCGLRKLNRTSAHRQALFRNMCNSLIKYEHIQTTLPKAKELRPVFEKLLTIAKQPTTENRRLIFARLRSKEAVKKLCEEIAPRSLVRPGGYLRILKNGFRPGDQAPLAYVELVDKPISVEQSAH